MSGFCHLHRHSEFSPLDGTGNAKQYADRAAELGQTALGLEDHATLGGALDHIQACRDAGITPIVGVEAFFRPDRADRTVDHNWAPHLTLQAASLRGWRSLLRLTTEAYMTGFYGKPCMDWDLLERHNEGIICSSACVSSLLNRYIIAGEEELAEDFIVRMLSIFGDRFYLEIMPHDFPEQRIVNIALYNFGQKYGIPLIATVDAHYPYKEWADTQDVVFMISRKETYEKRKAKAAGGEEVYDKKDTLYLMSEQEVRDTFLQNHPELPLGVINESISNTGLVVKATQPYVVSKDLKLPKASESPAHAEKILREWIEDGFEREMEKRGQEFIDKIPEYEKRIEFEMDILRDKGVLDYFVIVGDVMRWAKSDLGMPAQTKDGERIYLGKKKPIRVALGRGSAAGCLVSYLIGITGIDPIAWNLLFERFLNPNRKGLPDIDLDFDADRRWEVKEYLVQVYGRDHVADIISYNTFGPKAAIESVGKVFGIPYSEIDAAKSGIGDLEKDLDKLVLKSKSLQKYAETYPEAWEHSLRIDNMVRAPSKHAAGVVITDKPIYEYMPLQVSKAKDGKGEDSIVTAWADRAAFPIISDFGFLKMDFLGVIDLTIHDLCCDFVEEKTGVRPNLDLPCLWNPEWFEEEVMEAFRKFFTLGVFQFQGPAFKDVIEASSPGNVQDLAADNALVRPGARNNNSHVLYGERKRGEKPLDLWHESVEPFLGSTYGILLYQEQVMRLVQALGHFSPGDADDMRKAMSKLYRLPGNEARDFMQTFREKWDAGEADYAIGKKLRDLIWEEILSFADYSFNLSHAASYALQAYQAMHLKVHYPAEYYAALLSYHPHLAAQAVREARHFGVEIKPPDINKSGEGFTLDDGKLLYGLSAIRNLGPAQAKQIIEARPFESYEDFLQKMPSLGAKLSLVKSGAFDSLVPRERLLTQIKRFVEPKFKVQYDCGCEKVARTRYEKADLRSMICPKHEDKRAWGQVTHDPTWTVAEFLQHNVGLKKPRPLPETGIVPSQKEVLDAEKEMLGVGLSIPNAIIEHADVIKDRIYTTEEIADAPEKSTVVVGGEVISYREIDTKNGVKMAFVDIEFGDDNWSCTLFPKTYMKYGKLLGQSTALMVMGKKNTYKGKPAILVDQMIDVEELAKSVKENAS